jgi:hypothetical protein
MMDKKQQLCINLIVLISLILFPFGAASAQEDPFKIYFNPDQAYIDIDESITTTVSVDLVNAVDIWSFDVIITYNATVATITEYTVTDRFGSLFCAKQENFPGYLRVSCTSLQAPFNGDGNLYILTFQGRSSGQTILTFERANFGNTDSMRVPVVYDNGEMAVVGVFNLLYLPLIANLADIDGLP